MPDEYCANGPEIDLVTFSSIGGVPIHYARPPVASYGCLGKPRTPRLDREFLAKLEPCFEELWSIAPGGRAQAIVSGGCYVEKAGMHGAGRAIDIDAIWWPQDSDEPPLITLYYPDDKLRYLGTEAILRKHLGLVLDFHYNRAHHDHFHCDDSQPVGFFKTASRVVFVQAACIYVFDKKIEHDSVWGPQTESAVRSITSQLDSPDDILTLDGWLGFLDAIALTAFKRVEAQEVLAKP